MTKGVIKMRKFAGLAVLLVVLLMSGGVSEAVLADSLLVKSISLAGYLDGPQEIRVDEDGKYAYVISHDASAFSIFDVSDTSNPTLKSSITDASLLYSMGLAVSGRYAYVVTRPDTEDTPLPYGSNSLVVIDIANPEIPLQSTDIKSSLGGVGGRNVVVDGNYAYVAGLDNNAVFIINISDPESPSHITTIDSNNLYGLYWISRVYTLAKQGRYLYIVSNDPAFTKALFAKIDVSIPGTPVVTAQYVFDSENFNLLNRPVGLVVKGKYAYVTTLNAPSPTNTVRIDDTGNSLMIFDVDNDDIGFMGATYLGLTLVGDNFKWLAGAEGLISVDEKYAYVPIWRWLGLDSDDLDKDGDYNEYLDSPKIASGNIDAGQKGGLMIVNIENPTNPYVYDGKGADWCTGQADEVCGYIFCVDKRGSTLNIIDATTLP